MSQIEEQFERLKEDFPSASIQQQGEGHWLEVDGVGLPSGWNPPQCRIAVDIPASFPTAKPDGFWLEPGLTAPAGFPAPPGSGEPRCGRVWAKVCYQPQAWDPARENFWRYVKAMLRYFAEAK